MAQEAKKRLNLTEVWLLINPQNPLKKASDIAEFEYRAHLCELLCAEHPWLKVSYFEAQTTSAYTAETLEKISKKHKNDKFVWLMGSDNMPSFHKWKNWQDIMDKTPVVIFSRETANYQHPNMRELKSPAFTRYRKKRCNPRNKLRKTPQWRLLFVPYHRARATEIREELYNNKTPSHLTQSQLASAHLQKGYMGGVCH